jgi:hypothetical protein
MTNFQLTRDRFDERFARTVREMEELCKAAIAAGVDEQDCRRFINAEMGLGPDSTVERQLYHENPSRS